MRVAGADVAGGRWAVVTLADGLFESAALVADLTELARATPDLAAIAVDIPIGLPAPGQVRRCDHGARRRVGRLTSSVFPAPPAELIAEADLAAANRLARELGAPGVSAQAFNLRSYIIAVAPLAEADDRVHEVHPEVSFATARGGPLDLSKRTWAGARLRRAILAARGVVVPDDLVLAGRARADDVLDASIAAWTAWRLARHEAESIPSGSVRIGSIWA